MKKTILFLALAFIIGGTTVSAAQYIRLPWTKNIYGVSSPEDNASTVSVFDDGDNKCYVLSSSASRTYGATSISCVRK